MSEIENTKICRNASTTQQFYYKPVFLSKRIERFNLSRRIAMTLYLLFGFVIIFSVPSNYSMVVIDSASSKVNISENRTSTNIRETAWNSQNYALILGSFYCGSIFSLSIVGRMISSFGTVSMISFSSTLTGTLSVLTPKAYTRMYIIVIIRIFQGAAEMLMITSASRIWRHWFPRCHRLGIVCFIFSGTYLGSALSYAFYGYIVKYWHWSFSFYTTGSLTVFWGATSLLILREHPPNSRYTLGTELILENRDEGSKGFTKWLSMIFSECKQLASRPVMALIIFHFSLGLGTLFIRSLIPLYVKDTLLCNINKTGIISSLALVPAIFSFSSFQLGKYFIHKQQYLTRTQIMKLFAFLGLAGSCLTLVFAMLATNLASVLGCLSIFAVFSSLEMSPMFANSFNLAPGSINIAITASVLAYTISQLAGSLLIGLMVFSQEAFEWKIILGCFAGLKFFGLYMCALLSSNDIQLTVQSKRRQEHHCNLRFEKAVRR